MSEITKACPNFGRLGCTNFDGAGLVKYDVCPLCNNTRRVPDIEATLRAQLDAARLMCERFDSALRGKEGENAELRAEVGRLTEERGSYRTAYERQIAVCEEYSSEVERLTAEVERLTGREREAEDLLRDGFDDCREPTRTTAWLAGCKS